MTFFQQCINGLSLGSMYALIAIGYTMVYGCLRLINFAHADIMMVGAFLVFFAISSFDLPFYAAAILSIALCGILGVMIDKIAYTPLRNAPRISMLITAIGVSFFWKIFLMSSLALHLDSLMLQHFSRNLWIFLVSV